MTREEKVARAHELRGEGLSQYAIARKLGIAQTTVRRWLNPAAAERDRQLSLAAKQRRKTRCPECGRVVGYQNAGELCGVCKDEAEHGAKRSRILAAWHAGDSCAVIGAREGMTAKGVSTYLSHRRERGHDVPRRQRSRGEAWDYILRRWNEDHATAAEIAAELGTTKQNVTVMVATMRRAGLPAERRLPSRKVAA